MTDTRAERLAAALNDFIRSSPDVEAAAVVSFDGLALASALPPGMDEDRLAAMSAALLGLGEQAAIGLGRGEMRQLFVEGDAGFVFLLSAKDQAVLAAVTSHAAKIGFMLFEARRSAAVIGDILEQPYSELEPDVDLFFEPAPVDVTPSFEPDAAVEVLGEEPLAAEPFVDEVEPAAASETFDSQVVDGYPLPSTWS